MRNKLARHPLTRECYPTAMGFYPSADLHRMQRLRHDDNLLIYCVEGQGHATAGNWRGLIGPGQVLLLPQGVAHAYEADGADPWTIYWVHFQGSSTAVFNQYLGDREGVPPVTQTGISPQLVAHFRGLMAVHRTGYNTRAFMQSLMLEHIGQPLNLDTLAAAAKLSKFHFSNKYKALTGYSPMKHFLNMKMEHACHLLDTSQLSIKGVAAALGYDDQLYFSRQFSKTVGMSPRTYRRSVRS